MKFRRILAAVLSALMLASTACFTASVSAEDGAIAFDGNSYTADTYFEDALIFVPVFGEDNTVPYYRFCGE